MTEEMENSVQEVIETTQTSEQVGPACTGWTRGAVMEYIYKTYGIFYSLPWIGKLLKKWGFTPQKPIKHAIEQKLEEVERWVEEEYPRIKERARKEKAIIFFGDETGFRSTDIRGRVYGIRGKKPIAERPVSRLRCNMVCAVSNQGKLIWKIFQENFTVKVFIEFLSMLRSKVRKKIFLIMDNHRVHHSIDVRKWLWKHRKRIKLFFLPPYFPEVNPQELVNQYVKSQVGSFQVMKKPKDMVSNLVNCLTQLEKDPNKVRKFFHKKEVKYASSKAVLQC